jgi:hypothetical protein
MGISAHLLEREGTEKDVPPSGGKNQVRYRKAIGEKAVPTEG